MSGRSASHPALGSFRWAGVLQGIERLKSLFGAPAARRGASKRSTRFGFEPLEERNLLSFDSLFLSPVWFEDLSGPNWQPASSGSIGVDATNDADAGSEASDVNDWIIQLSKESSGDFVSIAQTTGLLGVTDFQYDVVRGLGLVGQVMIQTSGASADSVESWLATNKDIDFFELDVTRALQLTPDDPSYSQLWGLENTGQTGGTTDADIDASAAWDVTTGSSSIVVAVIDTGVDYTHSDLAANMWTNPGEIAGNGIDDDGNGFIDDIHGFDFVSNDGDPMDGNGHGTHVAGTIAAIGDDGSGITGVNWTSSIMALKFLSDSGSGTTSNAVRAVNYATMMRVNYGVDIRVTNNSWGGGGYSNALASAIEASGDAGILFVAAAGNYGEDADSIPHYPASYDFANVISVAATDHNDQLAGFSNYGATTVDLAAPGVAIYSTLPGNTYGTYSGTSMASPHVAGVAALAWSAVPNASMAQIRDAIMQGVDSLGSLSGKVITGGRLNASGTLDALLNVTAPSLGSLSVTPDPIIAGDSVALTLTASGAGDLDGSVTEVDFYADSNANGQWDVGDQLLGTDNTITGRSASITLSATTYTTGSHVFFARARDNDGEFSRAVADAVRVVASDDHANGMVGATVVTLNSVTAGDIEYDRDVDWFEFEAVAGTTYMFETTLGSLADSYVTLYDQNGLFVADDDDGGTGYASRLVWNATSSGTYYIEARAYATTQTGTYQLAISEFGASAVPIAVGETVAGNIDFGSDADWFVFSAVADTIYVFETTLGTLPDSVLTLYDASGAYIDYDDDGGVGYASRLFWNATTTGDVYVEVGAYSSLQTGTFQLSVDETQPFEYVGATLNVYGTEINDYFTNYYWGDSLYVYFNNLVLTLDPNVIDTVRFHGAGGSDYTAFFGTSDVETATLRQFSGQLAGNGFLIETFDTETIVAYGGSNDSAIYYDSSGNDFFVGSDRWSYLYDRATYINWAYRFGDITVHATAGGIDHAELNDTRGDDTFVASPTSASMSGTAYLRTVNGFEAVDAFFENGGYDRAIFRGSAGNDRYVATPNSASLTGAGFSNYAEGFDRAAAYLGQGGYDQAYLYDSAGNDLLVATPTYGYLIGAGFRHDFSGFERINVFASAGGYDRAYLHGSAGNDVFVGAQGYSYVYGSEFFSYTTGFDRVNAYATAGGYDRALLFDSAGNDVFVANPNYGYLYGSGFFNFASGFDRINASASGGYDRSYLYDSAGNDVFVASPTYRYLYGADYFNYAYGFERVNAFASGGYDRALLFDSAGSDKLVASSSYAYMYNSSYFNYTNGFDRVSGISVNGGADRLWAYAVSYYFELHGDWI